MSDLAKLRETAFKQYQERISTHGLVESFSPSPEERDFTSAISWIVKVVGKEICYDRPVEVLLWLSKVDDISKNLKGTGILHIHYYLPRGLSASARTDNERLRRFFRTYIDPTKYDVSVVTQEAKQKTKPKAIITLLRLSTLPKRPRVGVLESSVTWTLEFDVTEQAGWKTISFTHNFDVDEPE